MFPWSPGSASQDSGRARQTGHSFRRYSCFTRPEIEAEERLVEGNRQLIERMEQKIAATLARIWGEDSTAVPRRIELAHASNMV